MSNRMASPEKEIILRVVERYIHTGSTSDEQVTVTCLARDKTSQIEHVDGESRIVLLDEYKLGGQVIWASYSKRSGTVYLSSKSTKAQ